MQWMQQAVSQLVGQYSPGALQQKSMLSRVQSLVAYTFPRQLAGLTDAVCLVQEQLAKFFTASTELLETAGESDTCWAYDQFALEKRCLKNFEMHFQL